MIVAVFALALAAQAPAPPTGTQAPAAAAKARFGPQSLFSDMLADPKARAILERHIPLIVDAIDQGVAPDDGTLVQVSQHEMARTAGGFTDEAYKAILADFAKL